jgi:FlaA1/EpsC-like NDP-sugar epimerase
VPSLYELTTGKPVSQLRRVEIEDLLGREAVALETEEIRGLLAEKTVMVTGAGGSIGNELSRQIASYGPRKLLLVDRSEGQLFQLEQQLIESGRGHVIVPLVADVRDQGRMSRLMEGYSPSILFHAAAHKHVPMMEEQPGEAIKNNALATFELAELAASQGVERFIFISTDKAINPTNVMGATKRLAEMSILALQASDHHATKFIAVRFGNVLGSSGSVIPTFRKQIDAGGPVRVTHPDVTRYFMTIPEAAGLVLQSAAQGAGGEIFTLDMGSPVRILDLARQLIHLSGLVPNKDIDIQFIGLRPGEKLFEELSYAGENVAPTTHPKIMRYLSQPVPLPLARRILEQLTEDLDRLDADLLKLALKKALPEYQPQFRAQYQQEAKPTLLDGATDEEWIPFPAQRSYAALARNS